MNKNINEPLSDTEYDGMAKALIAWFESQDINPKDAGVVMIRLAAVLFVENSTDINVLNDAIKCHGRLLTTEIAVALKLNLLRNAKT